MIISDFWQKYSAEGVWRKLPHSEGWSPRIEGISKQLCTGTLGIAMKLIGALVILSLVFIIGYVTGYYIHK
ncbi:small integral membrane protein 1 [Huso huso]|uniref:Small integral membrane protein 1 n=1 Tax=Huso huso TaxID=61971 RepID=A0ABR0YYA3_HUSHU